MKTIVLSVGGSLIVPEEIDRVFLRKFRKVVLSLVSRKFRVAVITGGGMVARTYQRAARELGVRSRDDLDWMGIAATRLNAELVRSLFGSRAESKVLRDPKDPIRSSKKIFIGAGFEPGWSTDMDAVLLAKNLGAAVVVNLSNIDFVYTKDPRKFPDASPLKATTWDALLKITGTRWTPGLNAPFDPEAAKRAKALGLTVVIMNGKRLGELTKYLAGKPFRGTVIRSF